MARYALYLRTSTATQQEAETIDIQRHILQEYVKKHDLVVYSAYEDDGVTSGRPLFQRPQGSRLLADIRQGVITHVLTYSTDRLFRDVEDAWSSYKLFIKHKITVQTPIETVDFSTAMGRLQTGLKALFDEYEKYVITERLANGRARSARKGKYTYGVVPFGLDVDTDGYLVHSQRTIHGKTEAELVRQIFENIANGSTLQQEANRLTSLGIPACKRYINGTEASPAQRWHGTRLSFMIKSRVYIGVHTLHTSSGDNIERHVEPLISQEIFNTANAQVSKNRSLPKGNQKRVYLLRGLITCANCGHRYVGASSFGKSYYRCSMQTRRKSCNAKRLNAIILENFVWQECCKWIQNPREYLTKAHEQLQKRLARLPNIHEQRSQLQKILHNKSIERDRAISFGIRAIISEEELEKQLNAIDQESNALQVELRKLESQQEITNVLEARYHDQEELLIALHENFALVEASNDVTTKRGIIERMVIGITAVTSGTGHHKEADITTRFFFGEKHAAFSDIINQIAAPTPLQR